MSMNATTFENAPCVGRWWLWDSVEPEDHAEAARGCSVCPAFDACRALLEETRERVGPAMTAAGGGATGTWAGEVVGKRVRRAKCGTESGYYRHRRCEEVVCDDCSEAHASAESRRYSRRRLAAS